MVARDEIKGYLKTAFSVNLRMIPSKFAYLLYGGHYGSYVSFLNVFFVSVGLSVSQAGLITGLMFAPPIITGPMWGYISDRTGRRRLVLFLLSTGASVFMFAMPWVAHSIQPLTHPQCNSTMGINNSVYATGMNLTGNSTDGKLANINLFWILLALAIVASIFLLPLPNYMEALVMNVATSGPKKASFGAQRVIGSIGMSVTAFLAGKASDNYTEPGMSPYTAIFFIFLPVTILLFPIGCILVSQLKPNNDERTRDETSNEPEEDNKKKERLRKDLSQLLLRHDVIFFMATVFISGIANSTFLNFSYLLVRDVMKRDKTEMTFVIITGNICEGLFFPLVASVINILHGPIPAIILGTFAHFVRFLVMSLDVPFGAVVGIQVLSALAFALSYAAFMDHVHMIAPPAINMTINAIMMVIFHGGGNLMANMAGGKIYELYGGRKLFFGVSLMCVAWCVLMVVYYGGMRMKRKHLGESVVPPNTGIDNVALEMVADGTVNTSENNRR